MQHLPRRVIVTGAAGGIGARVVEAFVRRGDTVWGCDLGDAAANHDPGVTMRECDISDRSAARAFVAEAVSAMGGLDVLVDNVGIGGPTAPIEDISAADWRHVLAVNLDGTFWITQAAVPAITESGRGAIVVMSSLAGRVGYPQRLAYATSKWGLVGFAKTLALELGSADVTVNAVLPGAVAGGRMEEVLAGRVRTSGRTLAQEREAALANQSLKRFVTAEEVAELIAFLTSDAARSISGQAFPIDGDSKGA
ncbi:SDR family oxidoreductase [Microbacterium sp. EYE_512]|uniref:SDR family oxidoreductase n=2 Tax=Microbacteriaceae TaxID=85023 RepID=A0ABX5SWL2_9MICO|nr:SDR family oxidoreductase [Microbacterium sp. EYE_512]QBR90585.1 SDR family oxidoreductase [Microbacterium wangchenii]TXK18354.1 SDR family oxidoreductase [Microbacterium wangchenii]